MKQNVIDKIEIEWLGKYAGYNLTMFHKEEMIFSLWFTNVTYNSKGILRFYNEKWGYLGMLVVKDINNLEQLYMGD